MFPLLLIRKVNPVAEHVVVGLLAAVPAPGIPGDRGVLRGAIERAVDVLTGPIEVVVDVFRTALEVVETLGFVVGECSLRAFRAVDDGLIFVERPRAFGSEVLRGQCHVR